MDKTDITKINSKYILKTIFGYLQQNKSLEIIKESKMIQSRLDININDYKKYYNQIEIEIIPKFYKYNNHNTFINVLRKKDEAYYHIYFNDNSDEIKKYYFTKDDNIKKIKVKIDYEVKSLCGLFMECKEFKK